MKIPKNFLQILFPPKPPKQEVKVEIPPQWLLNADGALKPLSVMTTKKDEKKK
jgi:hypothetical protein